MTQAATAQTSTSAVGVSGSVLDESGIPLGGASVIIQEQTGLFPPQKITTNASGGYSFPAVGRGTFSICVTAASGRYLNPCLWAPFRDPVDTKLAGASETRTIRVEKAGLVRVLVTDPTNASETSPGQPGLQMGVWNESGLFYPLVRQSQSARGAVLELAVPYEQDLRLGFLGKPLTVKLDQVPLDTRSSTPTKFRIPTSGTGIKEFALEVTGVAK